MTVLPNGFDHSQGEDIIIVRISVSIFTFLSLAAMVTEKEFVCNCKSSWCYVIQWLGLRIKSYLRFLYPLIDYSL